MSPFIPRPFDALGGVPGAHLGLAWAATTESDVDEVVALSRRCEDVDGARVRLPEAVVQRTLTAAPSMIGRDRSGTVRACAGVRADGAQVAVRALVDPTWRGRGVGRAILAWQDRWARDILTDLSPSTIAVPIGAHLVDRRRLYTAAGFSSRARIELTVGHLDDARPDGASGLPAGWTIRSLRPGDAGIARRSEADPLGFVAAGMTREDLLATCEPSLSLVAEYDGVARAAVLLHVTVDASERAVGWSRALFVDSAPVGVLRALLSATLRGLTLHGFHDLYLLTTPAVATRWRPVLHDLGCEPVDVELLYSIETP